MDPTNEWASAMNTKIRERLKKLNRLQIAGLTILCLFVLYTITGFLILPPLVKYLMQKNISEQLHRDVTIDKVAINPFVLSLEVDGFSLKEKDSKEDDLASFKKLFVNLQAMSAFVLAPVIRKITLVDPYVKLVRIDRNNFNFSDLLAGKKSEETDKDQSSPFRFSLRDISVQNGTVEVVDRPLDKKHIINDINFTLPEIRSIRVEDGDRIEPRLTALINDSPVDLKGQVTLFTKSGDAAADIKLENINLPHYAAYLPPELKLKIVSGQLNVKTHIDYTQSEQHGASVKISGDAALTGVKTVTAQGSSLLELEKLALSVAEYDLFAHRLHIARVEFSSPSLNVSRDNSGQINFTKLYAPEKEGDKKQQQPAGESAKEEPFWVVLDELKVANGKILFSDRVPTIPFETALFPVTLNVKNFSTAPESKTNYSLEFKSEAGESIAASGTLSTSPLASTGNLKLSKVLIPKYSPYFKNLIQFDIHNTTVDLATDFHFAEGGQGPWIKLNNINSSVNSLQLRMKDADGDFLNIGTFALSGGQLDLAKKHLSVNQISSQKGHIHVIRDEGGNLNLQKLLPEAAEQTQTRAEPASAGGAPSWLVTVKNAKFNDYSIKAEDLKTAQPTTITADNLQFNLNNFSTTPANESDVSLSLRLNNKGKLALDGKVKLSPLYANLKLNLADIEMVPLSPYYRDYVKVYVTGGNLSANGNLVFDQEQPEETKISYLGDFAISDFTSLPKIEGQQIVKWQTFALEGIDTGNTPPHVKINKVNMVGFTSFVRVNPDGTINFRQVLKETKDMPEKPPVEGSQVLQPAGESRTAANVQDLQKQTGQPKEQSTGQSLTEKAPLAIEVGQIALQDGVIDFTDNLIEPNFHASFYDASGTPSGLSSRPGTSADVQINAKVDEYAPAEISGRFNPLTKDLFVDLTIAASNIDMTISNPYAQKFAGYHIEKGKLSFDFQYKIDQGKLDAHHHVEFDNLTLGDKVDSPDATDLPLKFALSLMQDRNGDIILDVPVSGELDNPQFDFSQVIKTAISNFFMKIVTAPFALLGSIFGAGKGEDLQYVEFSPGSSEVTPEAAKKLDVLAKGLYERPNLELDVAGYVDKKKDAAALAEQKAKEKVASQEAKGTGKAVKSGAEGKVESAAKQTSRGKKSTSAKETSQGKAKGIASKQPQKGAAKPKQAEIKISTQELKELAGARAKNVRDYIVKAGKIEAKRIFVVSPQSLQPKKKEAPANNTVILSLK